MGAITASIPRDHRSTKGSCCRSAVNVSSVGNGLCSPSINPRTMSPPPASKDTALSLSSRPFDQDLVAVRQHEGGGLEIDAGGRLPTGAVDDVGGEQAGVLHQLCAPQSLQDGEHLARQDGPA